MSGNFWSKLKKPIFVLAPMANVTDAAFRRIIAKYSRPSGPAVFWTEFVSVEGLLSRGREKLLPDLWFTPDEHPIVAQIFGGKPEQFYEIAKLLVDLGFDGVDINMGCPHDGVVKSCAGSDLIKDPQRAKEIITELKRGIKDAGSDIPVSVKTRIGYNKNEMETWLPVILEAGVSALTVHLRTRKEMSAVPAHWELMPRIVELRNQYAPETVLLGNGDAKDLVDAQQKVLDTGCDGVMLGRAIFGNPWLFREAEKPRPSVASGEGGLPYIPTTEEKLRVAVEHTKLFMELYGSNSVIASRTRRGNPGFEEEVMDRHGSTLAMTDRKWLKPFDFMKKHFKAYVNGFDGAKELRVKMMEEESVEEIESLVNEFLKR